MRTGERIKALRKKSSFTQKQLANKVHVSSQVISNWERGYSTPDSEDAKNLATALDCTADYLLGREEKKKSDSPVDPKFEAWLNDPRVDKFYREFIESPEECREALLQVWEILKKQDQSKK
ncbi:helix-turn-helix transcriptional regulator [Planococcus maritimus]|uniref:Helix-turn-helix transcriptional regulator n=1 Tax=Planococcus maritimus TaxID=192421 RepID=A0A7D7REN8_PLAMR|nr:helix-turn-helix transcriptional regulator [Planococcus maritimus]QMT16121.1 helix-turn-helix transcriptional regulator [Planococcus maritimus]